MEINYFTIVIREPVKPRPFSGFIYGLLLGSTFALIAEGTGSGYAADASIGWGYVVACTLGGTLIGALLPLFRNRFLAGFVVAVAASVSIFVFSRFSQEFLTPEMAVFYGCAMGFIYSTLVWAYDPRGQTTDPDCPDCPGKRPK